MFQFLRTLLVYLQFSTAEGIHIPCLLSPGSQLWMTRFGLLSWCKESCPSLLSLLVLMQIFNRRHQDSSRRKLPYLIEKEASSMLAVGLDAIEAVSCCSCARCCSLHSSYMSGQKFDQIPTGQAQHICFFNVKLWMFFLLALACRTTSTSSSARKHAALPLCILLYRNIRTSVPALVLKQ